MSEPVDEDVLSGMQNIQVAGIDTEILIEGNGEPLLFLHGLDGLENSISLIRLLSRDFRVYAPSHPGFGATALPPHFTAIDDAALFYLDLCDALDIGEATFVGLSFGGWIAAEVLVMAPHRASRLVLGAPFGLPTADRREQYVADIFMLSPAELQARMQNSPSPARVDPATIPEAMLERTVRNSEAAALYGWSPYFNNPKLRHRLHRVAMPTLILWGEDDRIAPVAYGRGFADAMPNAEFRTVANCGHRIQIDQPEVAAQAIRDFAATSSAMEEPVT